MLCQNAHLQTAESGLRAEHCEYQHASVDSGQDSVEHAEYAIFSQSDYQ